MNQKYELMAKKVQVDFEKEEEFLSSICSIYQLFYLLESHTRFKMVFQHREIVLKSLLSCPEFVLNEAYSSDLFETMIDFISFADNESIHKSQLEEAQNIFMQNKVCWHVTGPFLSCFVPPNSFFLFVSFLLCTLMICFFCVFGAYVVLHKIIHF